jgi:hypothetical protein
VELTQGEIHTFSVTSNNRKHRAKVEAKHSERERLIEEEIAAVFFTVDGGTVKDTGLKLTQLTWLIQPWAWDQRRVFSGVAVTFGDGHDGPDDFDGSDDFDDFDGPDGGSVSAEWMLGYQWWLTTWFAPYVRGQIGHSKTAPNELAVGTEAGGNLYLLEDLLVLRGGVKWSHEHGVYGFVGGGISWSVLGIFF